MKGYLSSYVGAFESRVGETPNVDRIEIPLIQRDYAQGRPDGHATDVRATFLTVLVDAVSGGNPLGLDFIYGNVERGILQPLDGQQRLTTLFLLHWYLASASGDLDPQARWTSFSYETRPSARRFCQRLVANPLPQGTGTPSIWITDQWWYLHVWRHDPSIQAMLVMLDAIDTEVRRRVPQLDVTEAWNRLTDTATPAVTFYLLPLDDLISGDELYIKMNSRGKPLTPFENFKARFERDIEHSPRAEEFARKVDGRWSDLLWPIHGGDNIVDDELIRYINYLTEICEFAEGFTEKPGTAADTDLGRRARRVFGEANPRAQQHLDFLFDAFDAWESAEYVSAIFASLFSTVAAGHEGYGPQTVTLFGATSVNLFEQCCHHFDSRLTRQRPFTLQQSLLLYAVLLHVIHNTDDVAERLRMVRNLVAASDNEIRRDTMPELLSDVESVITRGDLAAVGAFNTWQVEDEKLKHTFLQDHPELKDVLFQLEDHDLLRGSLGAFELNAHSLRQRAVQFEAAFTDRSHWPALTGALLATGEYQRMPRRSSAWRFGTSSARYDWVWRYVLTDASRERLSDIRSVLARFLDGLAESEREMDAYLKAVSNDWINSRSAETHLDWRYYLVKYPSMREGATGVYYALDVELGYSMCMLRTMQRNGNYRDPYLLALWRLSEVGAAVEDPWFTGYESTPRWLRLRRSGTGIQSVAAGLALDRPESAWAARIFDHLCAARDDVVEDGEHLLVKVPQRQHDGEGIDTEDRIEIGAALLREFVAAGL